MPDITVTCEGIAKLLNVNPNKAADPEQLDLNSLSVIFSAFENTI
jgi:hypothetical protein